MKFLALALACLSTKSAHADPRLRTLAASHDEKQPHHDEMQPHHDEMQPHHEYKKSHRKSPKCPDISKLKLKCSPSEHAYGVQTGEEYTSGGDHEDVLETKHAAGPCVTVMRYTAYENGEMASEYDLACASGFTGGDDKNAAFFKCSGTYNGEHNGNQYFEGNWNPSRKHATHKISVLALTGNEKTDKVTRRSWVDMCEVESM